MIHSRTSLLVVCALCCVSACSSDGAGQQDAVPATGIGGTTGGTTASDGRADSSSPTDTPQDGTADPPTNGNGEGGELPVVCDNPLGFEIVNGSIDVFGIAVHGNATDEQLTHGANVLAQWLDNDEDCVVDNQAVVDAIIDADQGGVCLVGGCDTTVFDDELHPPDGGGWPTTSRGFDASVEEIHHVVTQYGYAGAYPSVFGERAGTTLAMALDIARDSTEHNDGVPTSGYGPNAWFHYDDPTCEYNGCQITEYFYWAVTSLLGLQADRCNRIDDEWELCTPDLMMATDAAFMELYNNPEYAMPKVTLDATYRH